VPDREEGVSEPGAVATGSDWSATVSVAWSSLASEDACAPVQVSPAQSRRCSRSWPQSGKMFIDAKAKKYSAPEE